MECQILDRRHGIRLGHRRNAIIMDHRNLAPFINGLRYHNISGTTTATDHKNDQKYQKFDQNAHQQKKLCFSF